MRSGPEPEKLASTRAAAHTVVDRGMVMFILKRYVDSDSSVWLIRVVLPLLGLV